MENIIQQSGWLPKSLIESEIEWFYEKLGIDDVYFQIETPDIIANNITSLYAAKVSAYSHQNKHKDIRLEVEASHRAFYIDTSEPGQANAVSPQYEGRIEERYLDSISDTKYRVETFSSLATVGNRSSSTFRCYFVDRCEFKQSPHETDPKEIDLQLISDSRFWRKTTENTKQMYSTMMKRAVHQMGPIIEIFAVKELTEKRLVIAFRSGSARGLLAALNGLFHYYSIISPRKYLEQFSNGITIMSIYLRSASLNGHSPPMEQPIQQIGMDISLLYCLPQNKFYHLFTAGELSLQEAVFAHSAWVFVQYFLNRLGPEYTSLYEILNSKNNAEVALLLKLKRRLRTETFTSDYILEIIRSYPSLVRALYASFASIHLIHRPEVGGDDNASAQSVSVLSDGKLKDQISQIVANEEEEMVMTALRVFNNAILKTNYFMPTKVALSFRLDPSFLPKIQYPKPLHGMFLVIGAESRGFHLRFRDVSYGGIRVIKSRSKEAYSINANGLFDTTYRLASTQQDLSNNIPEGGAQGVILLDVRQQDKAREAFQKYVDSILDLILPARIGGAHNLLRDLYGSEEIVFMGPDENTTEFIDWAIEHAGVRGLPWWKSFFAGKSPRLGGIPHGKYSIATLSLWDYIDSIYKSINQDPSAGKKVEIGEPNGENPRNSTVFHENHMLHDTGIVDALVPEGEQTESVGHTSISQLIENDQAIFPYIIEGANLFGTKNAQVPFSYKDASVNRGSVMSSSLEVLASLSFDDQGLTENMCVNPKTGKISQFYQQYVWEAERKIRDNSRLEFEAIWREYEQTGNHPSVIAMNISVAIAALDEKLQCSELWANKAIQRVVLQEALPALLLKKIGLTTIMSRVPESYLRSIFSSHLASRFIYEFGSEPSQFAFYDL